MVRADSSTHSVLIRTPFFAICNRELSRGELQVLLALGSFADRSGLCWPSRATLSSLTHYPVTRISEITGRLCRLGFLEKEGGGGRSSCHYRICWDGGAQEGGSHPDSPDPVAPPPPVTPGNDGCGRDGADPELFKEHPEERTLLPLDTHFPSEEHTIVGEKLPTGSSLSSNFSLNKNQACSAEPAPAQPEEPSSPFPQRNQACKSSLSASGHEFTTVPATPPCADPSPSPSEELVFPPGIEPAFALALLASLAGRDRRQAVLDELAARMQTGSVRYPYGYLKTLAQRTLEGRFIPDAGRRVAEERRRRTLLRKSGTAPPSPPRGSGAGPPAFVSPPPPPPASLPSGRLGKALERLGRSMKNRVQKATPTERSGSDD